MTDLRRDVPDELLEPRLRDLGAALSWPTGHEVAPGVMGRLVALPAPSWRDRLLPGSRSLRSALLVAVALLLVVAAVAAAIGIGLPGLRLVFVEPGRSGGPGGPPAASLPVASAPVVRIVGGGLGLGPAVELAEAERITGFRALLPAERLVGVPDRVFVQARRLSLAWAASSHLPEVAPGVGLLSTQFRGDLDGGWLEKLAVAGDVTVEPVQVDGTPGWWLSGEPHELVYVDELGRPAQETRRMVGDVLLWTSGELTLRLESGLGREATIELAESMAERP